MSLLYTITHTDVLKRLLHELDAADAAGLLSTPIKDSEARSLPYLQAVLKESMRIFPAVAAPFFKVVPPEGDVISGHKVPAGTLVGVNAMGVLRSPRYWGGDANVFRPERWLEAGPEQLQGMGAALEVIFGFGRYKCFGRGIGMMELNKTVPEVCF
jgi:cytochrome P450